jgi:hypothetical protein
VILIGYNDYHESEQLEALATDQTALKESLKEVAANLPKGDREDA